MGEENVDSDTGLAAPPAVPVVPTLVAPAPAKPAETAPAPVKAEVPAVVVTPVAVAAPVAEVDETVPPLGEVYPGDTGELATIAVRLISGRDDGVYDDSLVAEVMTRQKYVGLPEDGIIAGVTWALVLPSVGPTSMGVGRIFALRALGVNKTTYDDSVVELVKQIQADAGLESTGTIDTATWRAILA